MIEYYHLGMETTCTALSREGLYEILKKEPYDSTQEDISALEGFVLQDREILKSVLIASPKEILNLTERLIGKFSFGENYMLFYGNLFTINALGVKYFTEVYPNEISEDKIKFKENLGDIAKALMEGSEKEGDASHAMVHGETAIRQFRYVADDYGTNYENSSEDLENYENLRKKHFYMILKTARLKEGAGKEDVVFTTFVSASRFAGDMQKRYEDGEIGDILWNFREIESEKKIIKYGGDICGLGRLIAWLNIAFSYVLVNCRIRDVNDMILNGERETPYVKRILDQIEKRGQSSDDLKGYGEYLTCATNIASNSFKNKFNEMESNGFNFKAAPESSKRRFILALTGLIKVYAPDDMKDELSTMLYKDVFQL